MAILDSLQGIQNVLGRVRQIGGFIGGILSANEGAGLYPAEGNFKNKYPDASVINIDVNVSSQLMTHPLETGALVADHQVFNLTEIGITFIVSGRTWESTLAQMEEDFNASAKFRVMTKNRIYDNMVMQSMPYVQDGDIYDGVTIYISLIEVREASAVAVAKAGGGVRPRNSKDSAAKDSGQKNGEKRQSMAYGAMKKLGGLF